MISQTNTMTSSLAALCVLASRHHVAADPTALTQQLGLSTDGESFDPAMVQRAAVHLGLLAQWTRIPTGRLHSTPLPALALLESSDGSLRTVTLVQCDGKQVLLREGVDGHTVIESVRKFERQWTGELLITRSASRKGILAWFGLARLIPALVQQRNRISRYRGAVAECAAPARIYG